MVVLRLGKKSMSVAVKKCSVVYNESEGIMSCSVLSSNLFLVRMLLKRVS